MRSGILIAIVGAWLVLRTVRKDATDRNLVDRILGNSGDGSGGDTTAVPMPPPRTPSAKPVVDPSQLKVKHPSTTHLVHPVSRM